MLLVCFGAGVGSLVGSFVGRALGAGFGSPVGIGMGRLVGGLVMVGAGIGGMRSLINAAHLHDIVFGKPLRHIMFF